MRLKDENGGTRLGYTVEAHVGGKLAQIGSRLIDATARKMAEDFFSRFSQVVGGGAPAAAEAAAAPQAAAAAPARKPGLSPWVWVVALIVLVGILLYAFTRAAGH